MGNGAYGQPENTMSDGFFTSYPGKGLERMKVQVASPAKGATCLPPSNLPNETAAGASTNPEDAEAVRKFIEEEGLLPSLKK
jgi:hypothetical protein